MTKHMTGTRDEWLAVRLELLEAEKSSRGAATSWRGGGRSCRGFGSTRRIGSRPTRGAPRWRTSSGALAAPRLSLHVRLRSPAHRRAPGMHRMLLGRRSLRRCHPPLERPRHHPRLCVDRPVAGAPGLQAANGLAIPVGFVARERLQLHFGVAFTEEQRRNGADYNFRHADEPEPQKEGMSVFALQDGAVHHTYSTYARGVEALMGTYQFLDLAPWGRNEDGLEFPQAWWRRHDEYDQR